METGKQEQWRNICSVIKQTTLSLVDDIKQSGDSLNPLDVYMMAFGKCLELYSCHYPQVFDDDKTVGIKEAVDSIKTLVSESLNVSVDE